MEIGTHDKPLWRLVKLLLENLERSHRELALSQLGGLDYNVFIIEFMQKAHVFHFPSPYQIPLSEMPKALRTGSLSELFCLLGTQHPPPHPYHPDSSMAHIPSSFSNFCSKLTISKRPFLTPHLSLPLHFLSFLLCALFSFSMFLTLF